jgi:hypothetical protein
MKPKPNTFKNTFCIFTEAYVALIENKTPDFFSKSGSEYFYTTAGMYRYSNHWGRLANSKWRLIDLNLQAGIKKKLGFANWQDFYPDNDIEKLYYISVDFDLKTATYQHKNNPEMDKKAILRTSLDTKKRLKQIKNILELHAWAKYFEQDIDQLRKEIVNQLIYTNKTLDDIKTAIKNR